jgi:hypothetical protein
MAESHKRKKEAKQKRSITPGAKSKVKSSAQRGIRSKILEEYPKLEPYIEDILPKKEQLDLVKLYVAYPRYSKKKKKGLTNGPRWTISDQTAYLSTP